MKNLIAAIATPLAPGGIGILRISGEGARHCAGRILIPKGKTKIEERKSHTAGIYDVHDEDGFIDEALCLVFDEGKSFSGEETVEIQCHGGVLVMERILSLLLKNGAQMASPGEFTKRAFLNGRLDLTKAEAIADVIAAENDLALKGASRQLRGVMSEKIAAEREALLGVAARIIAKIEYPEDDIEDVLASELCEILSMVKGRISELLKTYDSGRIIKEGISAVIVGRPNVGKSSLLNLLTGYDSAIVTNVAGTTRDILTESVKLGDVTLRLSDTAGIRKSGDEIENIGVSRALEKVESSDLVLFVVDRSQALAEEDFELINKLSGKRVICLLNKEDLKENVSRETLEEHFKHIVSLSAKNKDELSKISDEILAVLKEEGIDLQNAQVLINLRQKLALNRAKDSLEKALDGLEIGFTTDIILIDIEDAIEALGEITGEVASDDMISEVFSRFCLGK